MMAVKYGYEIDVNSNSTAAKVIRLVGSNKRVLEFGCSYGYMSKVLVEQFGCSVVGVELDSEAAKQAEMLCERVIVGNAEAVDWNAQLAGEQFDAILFADVLEHLADPWGLLETIGGFLAEHGYIIASLPNASYIGVVADLIHGRFRYRRLGILDNTHLRFFTLESIREMFESCGYVVSSVDRTKVPYEKSEFSGEDARLSDELLDGIKDRNPDFDTYQYVIKASKANDGNKLKELSEENQKLKERLNKLEVVMAENKEMKEYIIKVEKDIAEVNAYARKLEEQLGAKGRSGAAGLFKREK